MDIEVPPIVTTQLTGHVGTAMVNHPNRRVSEAHAEARELALSAIKEWSNGPHAITDTRKGASFAAEAIMASIEAAGLRVVKERKAEIHAPPPDPTSPGDAK